MAVSVTDKLKVALGYATFPNKEMKELVVRIINNHRNDLHDVGYEPSTTTEDEIKELDRVLNEYDERNTLDRGELKEAIKEAQEEEEAGQS
jgi:hypothetical protein